MSLLDTVRTPDDLKKLPASEWNNIAEEIRREIIASVSANGGHLASSLGVVELSIALHLVFSTPEDSIIWDVGHQAYAHKILTGRRELFSTLRQAGGCSGFQSRRESEHDAFGGGHAGTAVSAALGMEVAAMRRFGENHPRAVAVVGDGSLNCGISLEGLNSVKGSKAPLIIVLNDNRMSISGNVGALPEYLNRIISSGCYGSFRRQIKNLLSKAPSVYRAVQKVEEKFKALILPAGFFEELGFRYLGPVNGHSIPDLVRNLKLAKESNSPVVVHAITRKGQGYLPAQENPEKYHGVAPFDPETGIKSKSSMSFSGAFGQTMCEMASELPDLTAITAAMSSGTGLTEFARKYPERFFDTGIAEEHALVFAAGLAAGGMRPVAAIYSTFMQRAFDPVYHDVCLQNLPVIMALDRAGAVEDGPTHHGIYDLSFLLAMPNLTVFAPADEAELRSMLWSAYELKAPAAIRYSRGGSGQNVSLNGEREKILPGKAKVLRQGRDLAIWSYGKECFRALETADILHEKYGIEAAVVNARSLKPFDRELAESQNSAEMPIFVIEDHVKNGGFAQFMHSMVPVCGSFGWPDEIIPHGDVDTVKEQYGLAPAQIADSIKSKIRG